MKQKQRVRCNESTKQKGRENMITLLPINQDEVNLLDQTLKHICNQSLNDWLTDQLMKLFTKKNPELTNPMVTYWKDNRETIKYFTNRPYNPVPEFTQFELKFQYQQLNQPEVGEMIAETLSDHSTSYWTIDRLSSYLIMQLIGGCDEKFHVAVDRKGQMNLDRVRNYLVRISLPKK